MVGTPTPTPQQFANASSISSGMGDMSGLTPVLLFVIYALGFLVAAQFALPWLVKSTLISGTTERILISVEYAIKGIAATVVIGLTAAPIYFVTTADAGTRGVALRVIGYLIAGYLTLVVVGWLADRAVARAIEAHPDYDSWGDIWGGDEEPETPEVAD